MHSAARKEGFTLIELMMVVAIMGILATLALPRYRSYVMRSKTTEAVGFLAEIKSRQESYRADFGEYCNVSEKAGNYYPDKVPKATPVNWGSGDATQKARWLQLGVSPPGQQVLFRYVTVAGPPGAGNGPGSQGFTGAEADLGYQGVDFWFVSRALGDLNGDGTTVLFESYSHGQGLYCDQSKGWE